jgi:hypothetical protein
MSKMLIGSIDLNKIDKTKIVSTDKDGKPFQNGAKYLNVVVWVNDAPDQYGNDASIQLGQTKDDRDAGQKATYIGNLKSNSQPQQTRAISQEVAQSGDSIDLPF